MKRVLRVLNIEDQERDAALLRRFLERAGYELITDRVETPQTMRATLEAEEWDVILCDYSMPQFNALSALALLKEMRLDIPFIIISGTVGEEVAVKAMLAGAHDYMMKDNLVRLVPTIERELLEAENRHAHRRVEEALRESEDRYRDLVEHSHDLICTHDLDGNILTVNQAAVKLLGYDQEKLLTKNIRDILFSEDRDGFGHYIEELLNAGIAQGVMSVQTRTGEKRVWEYINTLRTEGVAAPLVRGVAHDITEQKRAEAELRKSEAGYRRLIDTTFEGVLIFDREMRITYVNRRLVEMLNVGADELIGRSAQEFVAEVSREDVGQKWQQRAEGIREQYDLRLQRKDGTTLWVIVSATPIFDEHGEFTGSLSMLTDITERMKIEEALRESEERFRGYFELGAIGMAITTASKEFISVNGPMCDILGYEREELLQKTWAELTHPDDLGLDIAQFERVIAGELDRYSIDKRWIRKDKQIIYANISVTCMRHADGSVNYFLGLLQDITERKLSEKALQESEARYRLLFESNPHPMWVYDLETLRFLAVNEAAVRHYGYSCEEFLAMAITDIRPHEDVPALVEHVSRNASLLDEAGVWRHRKKDGQIIEVEVTSHRLVFAGREAEVVLAHDVTERNKVEAALRLAEEKYRSIFENAVEGIFQSTLEGRFISVNPAFARILGYESPEDVIANRTDIEGQHYVDPNVRSGLERMLREHGMVVGFECEVFRKDFSKIWVIENIRIIRDENGAVIYYEGSIEEVTERKRAEEERSQLTVEIETQRQRLNNIIANVPGVVWETWGEPDASKQRIEFVSDHVESMVGYSVEEWLATPNFWLTIVHPDDRESAGQKAAATFMDGKRGALEFRWIAKDGHEVWVESNTAVILDGQGQPVGMRGVTVDITERKRAEQDLKLSEERYRELIENAHDIIYTHDLEGNYTSVNKAGEQIMGYTREESLKMNLTQTIAPEFVERARQMIRRKLDGENVTAYDLEVLAKNGRKIAVEVNTRIIHKNGVPVGVQGIARDVTERKQLEAQFRQSQKMEAIGQLAGGIAHDFNNLLTAITGYSELTLRRLQSEDPLRRNIEEIKKAGDRAASLTRQLLAFSRKQVLQPQVLDLNSIISDLEKMLSRLIGEDVNLRTSLEPQIGSIKADPGQIEQVIMNLAVNARDAMPEGGKLTIETKNVYLDEEYTKRHITINPGPYVLLAMTDTGTGIDETTRVRIFEPFYTTKEIGKGTGLGLSTVYGIVQQSGGNIWVYSEVGVGTTFKVYLPRVDEGAQEYKRTTQTEVVLQGSGTILLAEDEELVRTLAREVLKTYGYHVLEAANGGAALLICENYKGAIDLLITDVVMPEMGGRDLAVRLKQLLPELKVIYMSGYTDDAILHQGVLEEGANFIQKPFSPVALARKVGDVLNGGQGT